MSKGLRGRRRRVGHGHALPQVPRGRCARRPGRHVAGRGGAGPLPASGLRGPGRRAWRGRRAGRGRPALRAGGRCRVLGRGLGVALVHHHAVFEAAFGAQLLKQGAAQLVHVMLLQPVVEVGAGHLNGQHVVLQLDRHNGLEPGLEALLPDFRRDAAQAASPNRAKILEHESGGTKTGSVAGDEKATERPSHARQAV